jgi:lysine 6-dehydrogenase
MRIVIVGGGMQGRTIAQNLLARSEHPQVVIADLQQPAGLPQGVSFVKTDILDAKQATALVKGADVAVLAVPSRISREALRNLLTAGVPVADVCFTPEPPLDLDSVAKSSGSCCVVDAGVAPGLSHMLVGLAHTELGGLDQTKIWVGGMPLNPPPVFKHAIYFNAADLLSEYFRPARARRGGKDINPGPLQEEFQNFKDEELGNLQAFISDGLRSLLTSYPDVPDMAELTLRWTGHLETMSNLHQLGLLEAPETVQALAKALQTRFPDDNYPDVLLMVVEASRGKQHRAWRLIDRRTNDQSAMSRTTGFTTAAVAMLLARKQFTEAGVHAPERLGKDPRLVKIVIDDLAERGVKVTELVAARA